MGMISITTSAGGQRGHGGFVKQADGWVGGEKREGRRERRGGYRLQHQISAFSRLLCRVTQRRSSGGGEVALTLPSL